MKIIHIVPGFGGSFYCQTCLRDNALVKALIAKGHDVSMVPMYLPLNKDEPEIKSTAPIFFPAVNLYLKEKSKFLAKHMPLWLEKIFNTKPILNLASALSGSTDPEEMGETTLSLLRGDSGNQQKEMAKLIEFLKYEAPDIVHFSNGLLIGLAPSIKKATKASVFCSLQDEDAWIREMNEKDSHSARELLHEKSKSVDEFITYSAYYQGFMAEYMNAPKEKIKIIPLGINVDKYTHERKDEKQPIIGYVSRLSPGMGLDILVDAFIELKKRAVSPQPRLHAFGGQVGKDKTFVKAQEEKIKKHDLKDQVKFESDFHATQLPDFFQTLSILSVPHPLGEAFGTYQIEALASGTPLVQPSVGNYKEIADATGGSLIYAPNEPAILADQLQLLIEQPEKRKALAEKGRRSVESLYTIDRMCEALMSRYTTHQ